MRIQINVPPSRSNSTGLSVSKLLGELNATRINLRPAIGGPNISVQWFRDGVPLVRPTATNWDLQVPVNAYTIGHRYHVVATNAAGVVSSDDYIVAAPNLTAVTIESAYYEGAEWLRANGNDIAHYQWRINGVPIPGATSSILYTTSLYDGQALPSGFIDVLAFNRTQTVRSATFRFQRDEDAALPIETPTYAFKNLRQPYLSNLSIRGAVGVGEAALVPGFVISSDPIESLDRFCPACGVPYDASSQPAERPSEVEVEIVEDHRQHFHCETCGAEVKQRDCEPTGSAKPVSDAPGPQRWSVFETEYRCPTCGGSIWVVDAPVVYPPF